MNIVPDEMLIKCKHIMPESTKNNIGSNYMISKEFED